MFVPNRPLLAAKLTPAEFTKLRWPLLASPKLDGIRAITTGSGAVSRSLKPIPNAHVQRLLAALPAGLDGELILGSTPFAPFAATTSAIMSREGTPAFTYHVFDYCVAPREPYSARLAELTTIPLPSYVTLVRQAPIYSIAQFLAAEEHYLNQGYEGIMLRDAEAPYKPNRSTLREQFLIKLKRLADAEATVVGFVELQRNHNEPRLDNLGYQKRSKAQEFLQPASTLGALVCWSPAFIQHFEIGTGFTAAQREEIWNNRTHYLNATVTFTYQELGTVDRPRIPVFKGFRRD